LLDDSSISCAQLLTGGYDVVVYSPEFIENNYRGLARYRESRDDSVASNLEMPNSMLHSDLWKILDIQWKYLIIDEAHKV
jgi:SNF2 family DNA or RNA helicase